MQKRTLGRSAIEVSPLAFGGNVFGWTVDRTTAFRLLDQFVDGGFNLIDTADVYANWVAGNSGGESETIIGDWMHERGNRESVIIATKGGSSMQRGGPKNLSGDYLRKAVEDSLRRLRTDYIDLYQSHYDDPNTDPQETLATYGQLVQEGKIRWIGASNFTADRLAENLHISNTQALPRYQTLQPQYNLYHRNEFESTLGTICVNENISVLPYYSLASGFLTGKYRSGDDLHQSERGKKVEEYFDERGYSILDALDIVAQRRDATPAMIALAWLMTRPAVAAPIASATSRKQLDELMRSATIELREEDMDILEQASAY